MVSRLSGLSSFFLFEHLLQFYQELERTSSISLTPDKCFHVFVSNIYQKLTSRTIVAWKCFSEKQKPLEPCEKCNYNWTTSTDFSGHGRKAEEAPCHVANCWRVKTNHFDNGNIRYKAFVWRHSSQFKLCLEYQLVIGKEYYRYGSSR